MNDLMILIIGCLPGSIALGFGIGFGLMSDKALWIKLAASIGITVLIFFYVFIGSFWV